VSAGSTSVFDHRLPAIYEFDWLVRDDEVIE